MHRSRVGWANSYHKTRTLKVGSPQRAESFLCWNFSMQRPQRVVDMQEENPGPPAGKAVCARPSEEKVLGTASPVERVYS